MWTKLQILCWVFFNISNGNFGNFDLTFNATVYINFQIGHENSKNTC